MQKLSVIICTYNPTAHILNKCLDAITIASRMYKPEEIIIIDNNSPKPIENEEYIKSFLHQNQNARIIRECKQGLTPARLRGIKESTGDLILFIDDDNFIDESYFSACIKISFNYPFIGAFSGQVTLYYDKEPERWTKKYWGMLIYRELNENLWSNQIFNNDTMPNGAGLCVSRDVAEYYVMLHEDGKRNFNLDRSKESLLSGGDNDLAMCASDIGKGMGLFKDLHLKHYIPERRFTLDYLSKLAYGIYFSSAILQYLRTGIVNKETFKEEMKHLIRVSIMKSNDRIIQKSCKKGLRDAIKMIKTKNIR